MRFKEYIRILESLAIEEVFIDVVGIDQIDESLKTVIDNLVKAYHSMKSDVADKKATKLTIELNKLRKILDALPGMAAGILNDKQYKDLTDGLKHKIEKIEKQIPKLTKKGLEHLNKS